MEGSYDIFLDKRAVGRAEVARQGLYYAFDCRCKLSGGYKIFVQCGEEAVDLGVCVPRGGGFGLTTKIPVKRFSGENPVFLARPKKEPGRFVPLRPEEPFPYLAELAGAVLTEKDGQVGLRLPGKG